VLGAKGALNGHTVSIDGTTLEADAGMRSIVRRDSAAKYVEYLKVLAAASGIENKTPEELARSDRMRKKKTSNKNWKRPADPDSRVARMKDGRTHLAHKVEHAVDLNSGALVALTLEAALGTARTKFRAHVRYGWNAANPLTRTDNILKRLLIHAVAFNIAVLVRKLHRIGAPRTLQWAF
jgi:hypothetical protein